MIHYGEGSIARLEKERQALASRMSYWKNIGLRAGVPMLIVAIAALLGNFGVDPLMAAAAIAVVVLGTYTGITSSRVSLVYVDGPHASGTPVPAPLALWGVTPRSWCAICYVQSFCYGHATVAL